MKKLLLVLLLVLSFGITSAFAQDFKYHGFMKSVTDMNGFAIINDVVYTPGDMVYNTEYKLIQIEYHYIILENTKTGESKKVNFFMGKPKLDSNDPKVDV